MSEALEIKGLRKNYKEFSLKDISFTVPKGCIMGFVGENGAGKTTTIKAILNLINKDSGEIKVFGLDNIKDEKIIKENIGVVFDECCFHDNLKIRDISKIMSKIYKNWDNSLFEKYSQQFKVPNDKIIKEFSRGMKMKLSIAVALSHKPKLLILDEATSGLDPIVREEILDVFLDFIQDEEHSILLSTHITGDLDKIADYITFINDGEIIFSKSKDELNYTMGIVKCGKNDFEKINKKLVVAYRKGAFGYEVLINNKEKVEREYTELIIDKATIEDVMLFYIRGEK